ncbi:MAG: sugar ABC transporter permease [Clostridiales bacterium]|nr:sugar ABC transporter permease [Clostridiales bacterium]
MAKKHIDEAKRNKLIFVWVMLALPLLQFAVFTVYINLSQLTLAFMTENEAGQIVFGLFENIENLIINLKFTTEWRHAIWNSIGYIPVNIFLALPLSIITVFFISKKIWGSRFFTMIFYLPNIISVVVLVLVFKNIFDKDNGILTNVLMNNFNIPFTDIPDLIYDEKYAMTTLYVYCVWAGVGGNIVLLFGAVSRIPESVKEASLLDGCGPFTELIKIYVPLIWPTISTLLMFSVAVCFQMFMHTQVMTNGVGKTHTIAFIIVEKLNGNGAINYYYVSLLALIISLISIPTVRLSKVAFDKMVEPVEF